VKFDNVAFFQEQSFFKELLKALHVLRCLIYIFPLLWLFFLKIPILPIANNDSKMDGGIQVISILFICWF